MEKNHGDACLINDHIDGYRLPYVNGQSDAGNADCSPKKKRKSITFLHLGLESRSHHTQTRYRCVHI